MSDLWRVLLVGNQGWEWNSIGFGDDYRERVCWRCRESETSDPMETCKTCREELIDG